MKDNLCEPIPLGILDTNINVCFFEVHKASSDFLMNLTSMAIVKGFFPHFTRFSFIYLSDKMYGLSIQLIYVQCI